MNEQAQVKLYVRDFLKSQRLVIVACVALVLWLSLSYLVYRFEVNAVKANITSYPIALWWGIVTGLTVGYGDTYPVTTGGRIVAGFMMFTGVIGIGIITAKISAIFLADVLDRKSVV